jgi:aminopeptidase N
VIRRVARAALALIVVTAVACSTPTARPPASSGSITSAEVSPATRLTPATTAPQGAPAASNQITATTPAATQTSTTNPPSTAVASATTTVAPTTTTVLVGTAGEAGVGDLLYPGLGNGGIDVIHADLSLAWSPKSGTLTGTAVLQIEATKALTSFNLDFSGFQLDGVTVNGADAETNRQAGELTITPASVLPTGRFEIRVEYHGKPEHGLDTVGRPLGWLATAGGAYTLAEPGGASFWFPTNDHPSDKATYMLHVVVPEPLTAVANGHLVEVITVEGGRRFTYEAAEPMASYLVLVAIGTYSITEETTSTGLKLREVEPVWWPKKGEYLAVTAEMVEFYSGLFGPYPFDSYGVLLTDSVRDLAMETQTLSMFSAADMHGVRGDDEAFLAHELAHQWFGDAVSPIRWNDVWLNESFATYADWLWSYRDNPAGLDNLAEQNRRSAASDRATRGTTGHPRPASLFGRQVYNGGAIVLHALRREVGDEQFFTILQTWFTRYRYKSAGTEDFIAVASETVGRDLTEFLTLWLDGSTLPPFPPKVP